MWKGVTEMTDGETTLLFVREFRYYLGNHYLEQGSYQVEVKKRRSLDFRAQLRWSVMHGFNGACISFMLARPHFDHHCPAANRLVSSIPQALTASKVFC